MAICKKLELFIKTTVLCKKPWSFVKNHGYLQKTMVICKKPWLFIKNHGYLQLFAKNHGYL